MRRIVVDAARARLTGKRRGGALVFQLNDELDGTPARASELVTLDGTLDELARMDPGKAQVVELRFFGGLNVDETAEVLKVSPQTILRDWKLAKVWMTREMSRKP